MSKDTRVVLKVRNGSTYDKYTGTETLIQFKITSDLVNINGNKVEITNVGKSITSSQTVRVDIELKCGEGENDWIGVGSYFIILSPTPVLGATFPESSTGDTLSETIPDTEVSTEDPIFALNDGYIKVTMNQNTVNRGVVYFELLANPKYSYFNEKAPSPVRIYLIGGSSASYAKMYILSNGNTGGEISKTTSVSGIDSFDILGEDNDAAIATLSGGSLTFQQAGLWPIAITTSSGTNYYYVQVVAGDNNSYSATYYSEIALEESGEAAGGLMLGSIFGTGKYYKDMYEFSVSQQNAVGTDAINQLTVVQPSSKVEFFYKNGDVTYKIPFETATGTKLFEFKELKEGNLVASDNKYTVDYKQHSVIITNKFETVVATYVYQVNLNYSFPEDSFDEVIVSEDNQGNKVITSENSYNKNEFDSFKNETHYVSKTIELDAGKTYSLVNLLTAELGLKTFDGGTFDLINAKFSFVLTHGSYTTNSGFTNNLNSLISISKNGKDYIIAPHGAQNGGDIVHLKLDIQTKDGTTRATYYLRIHINPEVILSLVDTSGEKVLNFDGATDNPNIMNLPLSSLVYVNSAIDPSKLQVIVVSGDSAGYVQGEGSNRLQNQATDSSGSPAILTIHYRNSSGTSVGYNHEESSSQIFEGDTIEIWAKVESEYYQWDSNSNKFVGKDELKPEDGSAIIVLDNISSESIDNVTVSIAQSEELTQELNGTKLLDGTTLEYIPNTIFGSSERISGNNFVITVKTTTETLSFAINPTIMQRYRLEFTPRYNTESILYIPDIEYNETNLGASDKGIGKYFWLYDIKTGAQGVSKVEVDYTNVTKDTYTANPNPRNRYNANGFATGTGNNGTITINYNISGASQGNQISVGYQLTQKFFGIDTSGANVVGNYGVVVEGGKTLDGIEITSWGEGVSLLDYYGNPVGVSSSYSRYFNSNNFVGGTTNVSPAAGATVVINVYGDEGKTNQIGTLRVTRARYYGLNISKNTISGGNTLTFSGGTGPSDGWGEVIKAVVSGTTDTKESLVGGLSGFFTYEITEGDSTVVYDPSLGEYVINVNAAGTSFQLSISYMGHWLGTVKFTKSGSTWKISEPATKTVADLLTPGGGATQGPGSNTITISSLPGLKDKDFWLLDLTYDSSYSIYLGNGTNSLNLKGDGIIRTSGAKVIINSNAFKERSNLTQIRIIGDSLTSIRNSAFYGCTSLTSIEIPEGVTTIGEQAFYNCSKLTSITIPEGVTTIGNSAFRGCSSLTSIEIPDSVTSIGTWAFSSCKFEFIELPDGITSLSERIFNACDNLISVILPTNLVSIGKYAFSGCNNLTSIIIPKSVTTIAEGAFNWCNRLTEITINGNITSLGSNAFSYCSSLKKLTLGEGVTTLPSNLFTSHLTNLTEIVVLGNLNSSTFPSGTWIKGDSPTPVTSFSGAGTYSTKQLIAVTVETNETSLGSVSDGGSYDIGDTVELIATPSSGSTFLAWATSLDPNNMEILSTSATYSFELTEDSPTTYYALFNETTSTSQTVGNLTYTFYNEAKLAGVTATTSTSVPSGDFTIPSVVSSGENSYKVYSIDNDAFYGCRSLTSITIPEGVTSIGDEAFYNCSSLTSITIPEGVTSIGGEAFYWCRSLTEITIPESVISIGISAFANCENLAAFYGEGNSYYKIVDNGRALLVDGGKTLLAYAAGNTATSYTIPEGVTSIGEQAFYRCSSLTEITLPTTLTSIGDSAFYNCSKLTSITIPEGVTTIRNSTFDGCSSLTSVSLPSTLVSIGEYAFHNCTSLTSITIPEGVTAIGERAFRYCSNLTSITIQGSIILIGNNAFQRCNKLGSLTLGEGVTSLPDNLFDSTNLSLLTEIVVLGNLTSETFPSGTWTKGGTTVTQFSGSGTYIKSEE